MMAPLHDAPQHGPRPLPLFLEILRSETAASADRRAAALAGLAAYQSAPRPRPRRPAPARLRKGRARLRDYGGAGRPVILVPSLINPPFILDLAPGNSLAGWLRAQGFHPWLLDWMAPTPRDAGLDLAGHVERILLPLIARFDTPPILVGYCLGGTLALAAAARAKVAGLALIAAPWRFAGFAHSRPTVAALWHAARPLSEALGVVPMEVLQSGFWQLDPRRTIAKFERFATLDPGGAQARGFVAMEDWANGGAPLPYAAGAELFDLIAHDAPGGGGWHVAGAPVDPDAIDCPVIEFVSQTDRIVPAATAARIGEVRELALGHVGMVVGRGAPAALWQPLADWCHALDTPR